MHRDFTEAKCRKRPDISRRWKPKPSLFFFPLNFITEKAKNVVCETAQAAARGREGISTPRHIAAAEPAFVGERQMVVWCGVDPYSEGKSWRDCPDEGGRMCCIGLRWAG